ncbi:MAG TPA: twin-arginine translocation signal domain-containing protein [Gaiellaceae bacterium]|nr:twin-arginine translocation signal domain-containing protein [Gaiellaceae bacterium]
MSKLSRRSFLKTAGVATGAALVGGAPIAAAGEREPELVASPSPLPKEPLVAYVRDAEASEVTLVHGTGEVTYRDPLLVKRLLKHAAPHRRGKGGGVA